MAVMQTWYSALISTMATSASVGLVMRMDGEWTDWCSGGLKQLPPVYAPAFVPCKCH